MSAAEIPADRPKNCVQLLLETEPKELSKQIEESNLKTDREYARLKGQGLTIMQESDKAAMALYRNARGQTPVFPVTENKPQRGPTRPIEKVDEYLMPVLQGDCDGEE